MEDIVQFDRDYVSFYTATAYTFSHWLWANWVGHIFQLGGLCPSWPPPFLVRLLFSRKWIPRLWLVGPGLATLPLNAVAQGGLLLVPWHVHVVWGNVFVLPPPTRLCLSVSHLSTSSAWHPSSKVLVGARFDYRTQLCFKSSDVQFCLVALSWISQLNLSNVLFVSIPCAMLISRFYSPLEFGFC